MQEARKDLLRAVAERGSPTAYTTQEFLQAVEDWGQKHAGSLAGLSFATKNLTGLDLGPPALLEALKEYRAAHGGEDPMWYSGSSKLQTVVARPETIASANRFDTKAVIAKNGVNLAGVDFTGAILVAADLTQADLEGAKFRGARMQYASLYWTRLWDCDFSDARMKGVDLRRAALQNANLRDASLRQAILSRCLLYHARFDRTDLTQAEILGTTWEERQGNYRDAAIAYNRLKRNFAETSNYQDAAWAYIREMRMLALQYPKWSLRRLGNQLLDVLFRYGESPARIGAWASATILVFAAMYHFWGGLTVPIGEPAIHWYDSIAVSMRAFATVGNSISGNELFRMASGLEAMLGVCFVGVLVYGMGKRLTGY